MKNIEKVKISTEFIKLDQFLKWLAVVDSGSEAKEVILDGKVKVNDEVETFILNTRLKYLIKHI